MPPREPTSHRSPSSSSTEPWRSTSPSRCRRSGRGRPRSSRCATSSSRRTTCSSAAARRPSCARSGWPCATSNRGRRLARRRHRRRPRPRRTGPSSRLPRRSTRSPTAADRGARIVGLCAGAFVLGVRRRARRSPGHDALGARRPVPPAVPRRRLLDDELFVDDGDDPQLGRHARRGRSLPPRPATGPRSALRQRRRRLLVSPPFRIGGQSQYRVERHRRRDGFARRADGVDRRPPPRAAHAAALAEQAGTSARTLARRFDAEAGMSAIEWVTSRRVGRARALLEHSDLSVTDIAFATGFGSLSAFRRQFARRSAPRRGSTDRRSDRGEAWTQRPTAVRVAGVGVRSVHGELV